MPTMPDKEKLKTIDPDKVDAYGMTTIFIMIASTVAFTASSLTAFSLQRHLMVMKANGFSEVGIGPQAMLSEKILYSILTNPISREQIENWYLPLYTAGSALLLVSFGLCVLIALKDVYAISVQEKLLADSAEE